MPNFVHYIYLIPLLLSVIFSLKSFKDKWTRHYQLFSVFLMVTLLIELFAISWKLVLHQTAYWAYNSSNLWIYNLYLTPQYLFYFLFFSFALGHKPLQRFNKAVTILYSLVGITDLIFIQGLNQLNTYTIILGSGLVLTGSLSYFIQEFNSMEPTQISGHPLFWIASGSFIFHTVSLPYFIMINYLSKVNLSMAISLFNILLVLNILMYLFYLIAFLCNKPSLRKPL